MMLRLCSVVKVPAVGCVKISEPSEFFDVEPQLPSVPVRRMPSVALQIRTRRDVEKLRSAARAHSGDVLPVVTDSGGPVWN